jgi:hypothetical protein
MGLIMTKPSAEYRHPHTPVVEDFSYAWVWTLFFGTFHLAVKGVWTHVAVSVFAALFTFGFSWFVYPFFARSIMVNYFRTRGYVHVTPGMPDSSSPEVQPLRPGLTACKTCLGTVSLTAPACPHCGE